MPGDLILKYAYLINKSYKNFIESMIANEMAAFCLI